MLGRVLHRRVAGDIAFALRGEDLQLRRHAFHGEIEADLIVALAGRAMGHRRRAVLARRRDQMFRDQRPRQRRRQRIDALIQGIRLQRREAELRGEFLFCINNFRRDRAGLAGLFAQLFVILRLAHVRVAGDDVIPVLVGENADQHAGVEPTAIRQNDL